jgi:hypothetical protein
MRCPGALGDQSQPDCRAGTHTGFRRGRGGAARSTPRRLTDSALARRWYCTLVGGFGARRCANALISVIKTRSGFGCHTPPTTSSRGTQPWNSAGPWSARSRVCTTQTLLGPRQPPARPPPASAAAALDGHDRGRQGSPSRCRCWAARLAAALTRSRPRRSLRCWPGWPPTLPRPLPRQGRPPSGRPSGSQQRRQPGCGRPGRARQGPRMPARRGRAGAGARRPPSRIGQAPPAGRAAWRVAGHGRALRRRFGSRRWGWWERASRLGRSHERWACTRRRCAAGSGRPGKGGGPPWACRSPTALTLLLLAMRAKKGLSDRPQGRLRLAGPR